MQFAQKTATISIMGVKRLFTALLIVFIAIQVRSIARQNAGPSTFSISVNLVKVPISIFDANGKLVTELRSEDFRIWEDQAVQKIRSFGMDRNPVSVVLVVDISTSGKTELKKIKEAAKEFAEALSREDRVSLIAFDERVHRVLDWTSEAKRVRKALGKLRPGLRTSLYDAMYIAAKDQLRGIEGRKAIILLTDCLDNYSRVSFQQASLAVVQSQASLYVVSKTEIVRKQAKKERRVRMLIDIYKRLFGENADYIDEYFEKRETEMSSLAEQTGGRCFFPNDYNRIKGVYSEVARELKSKYYLTYVSNQDLSPNTYHRIALEYLKPAGRIIYRKGYYYKPQRAIVAPEIDSRFEIRD
jgi:VWFA-related protein